MSWGLKVCRFCAAWGKTLALFIFFLVLSCKKDETNFNRFKEIVGINIKNYQIVRNEECINIGGKSIVLQIKIGHKDFDSILKKVKNTEIYKKQKNVYYLNLLKVEENECIIINTQNKTITYSFIDR